MATIASILIDGKDPSMPALRAWLQNLSSAVSASVQGLRVFASEALLNAYTPTGNEPIYAFVADGTSFQAYRYAGGWSADETYFEGVAAIVQPQVDQVQAAAAEVAASLDGVRALLYVSPVDFNPNAASDTGNSVATENATLFIEGTFGDVFGEDLPLIDTLIVYATGPVPSFTARLWTVNDDDTRSSGEVIYTGSLTDGLNTLSIVPFIPTANNTLSGYSATGGLCRRSGTGPATGHYIPGDVAGDNLPTVYAGFTLMMAAAGRIGTVADIVAQLQAAIGGQLYRFWTFYEDSSAPGALSTGQLIVQEGSDGINFPTVRGVSYPGLPAGEYARDPSVFRDHERNIEFIAHSSHAFGDGDPGPIFTVAFARPTETGVITANYLASINVGAITSSGYNSAWAPEWVNAPLDPVRLLVSCNAGAGHKPVLLESTDYMHRSFKFVAALTGTQIPASCIDGQITCIGGRYVLIAKNEINYTLFAAQSTGDVTGPYDTPIALGIADAPIEGPQLVALPDGRVRLYADKNAAERMGARDAEYLGAAWGATVPLNSFGQAPMLHGTVLRITGAG
jgi:hypothetical protein